MVIDDTLSHKTGEKIEGVDWFFDHRDKRYTLAHQMVTSQFVTKNTIFLLIGELFRERTKNRQRAF